MPLLLTIFSTGNLTTATYSYLDSARIWILTLDCLGYVLCHNCEIILFFFHLMLCEGFQAAQMHQNPILFRT